MPPKTPRFWQEDGLTACMLSPLSSLYLFGHKIKLSLTKPYMSSLPVLCIGGVVAGGSGKTPVVHAIVDLIRQNSLFVNPVILSRGYGGTLKGPTAVDRAVHTADDVGDEALLHARRCATIISRDRAAGARLAEAMGADIIIMDDGLQNNALAKTMSLLVLNGIGNAHILPAGPLREPLGDALVKCSAIISFSPQPLGKPVFQTTLTVTSNHDKTGNWFAFAGIGNPEKFKDTLENDGFKIKSFKSFPDHHYYADREIEALIAETKGDPIITTEKDWVRLSPQYKIDVEFLEISVSFEEPDLVLDMLKSLA